MASFVEIERFPFGVEFGKPLRVGQKIERCGKSVEIISDLDACDKYKPKKLLDKMLDIRDRWEKSVGLKSGAKLTPRSIAKSLVGMLP